MNYLYREYTCRLSPKNCGHLLQSLALVGGEIKSSGCLKNGFAPEKISYWEGLFLLQFKDEQQLQDFHNLGFKTECKKELYA
jgi:hypothetical protein